VGLGGLLVWGQTTVAIRIVNITHDNLVTLYQRLRNLTSTPTLKHFGRDVSWPIKLLSVVYLPALPSAISGGRGRSVDRPVPFRLCGEPLPGREANFVLKYFLLRHAERVRRRAKVG